MNIVGDTMSVIRGPLVVRRSVERKAEKRRRRVDAYDGDLDRVCFESARAQTACDRPFADPQLRRRTVADFPGKITPNGFYYGVCSGGGR